MLVEWDLEPGATPELIAVEPGSESDEDAAKFAVEAEGGDGAETEDEDRAVRFVQRDVDWLMAEVAAVRRDMEGMAEELRALP
jgi:hypothetical protein